MNKIETITATTYASELTKHGFKRVNTKVYPGMIQCCQRYTYEMALRILNQFHEGFHPNLKIAITEKNHKSYVIISFMEKSINPIHKVYHLAVVRAKKQVSQEKTEQLHREIQDLLNEDGVKAIENFTTLADF
jgi:hypothetical protein